MADSILDGSGKAYEAKVDENNRLHVSSISVQQSQQSTKDGDSYNINSGLITLSNDVETPVIYLKNNELNNFNLLNIIVGLESSTGGSTSESVVATVVKNPTSGTIISDATAVDINSNRNFGINKTINADVFKGATGSTLSGGSDHILFFANTGSRSVISIDESLGKGSSIGIKIKPQTGNTSMRCYVALVGHLNDPANS